MLDNLRRRMLTRRVKIKSAQSAEALRALRHNYPDIFQELSKKDLIDTEFSTGPSTQIMAGQLGLQTNPDDLVAKKMLEIYDDMKKDDQVKAALFVKKYSRLSTRWFIKPASPSPKDKEVAEFYERILEQIPGTIIQVLLNMMTFLDYGFSVMEENYTFLESGIDKGKIGFASIKSRRPHDIDFRQDDHSNIIAIVQNQGGNEKDLPPEKFVLSTWMPEWEGPYGVSDLRAAYAPWWRKDVVMKFWAMFLERYPSPVMIGRYPPGTKEDDQSKLLAVVEDIQVKTSAIMQENMVIDTIEVGKTGADVYNRAVDKFDRQIAKSLLIPDLLGLGDAKSSGSYALGKKQFELYIGVLNHLGTTVEEIWNEQVTKTIIDLNFTVSEYPKLLFETLSEESLESKAKIIQILATAGFLDPLDEETLDWSRRYINVLPQTQTKASEMIGDALDFSVPFKFYSPTGDDMFEVDLLEQMARIEKIEDAMVKA